MIRGKKGGNRLLSEVINHLRWVYGFISLQYPGEERRGERGEGRGYGSQWMLLPPLSPSLLSPSFPFPSMLLAPYIVLLFLWSTVILNCTFVLRAYVHAFCPCELCCLRLLLVLLVLLVPSPPFRYPKNIQTILAPCLLDNAGKAPAVNWRGG